MKQLTEEQITNFKKLAKKTTSQEDLGDEWDSYSISGGNYDDAYWAGCEDEEILNARFVLDLFEIEY